MAFPSCWAVYSGFFADLIQELESEAAFSVLLWLLTWPFPMLSCRYLRARPWCYIWRVLPHVGQCSTYGTIQDPTNGSSFLKQASVALLTWICKVQDFVPVHHYSNEIICEAGSAVSKIIWGTTGSLFPASPCFFLLSFSLGFNCLIDNCFKGIYW